MRSNDVVSHTGRIVEITPQFTTVEIVSASACGSCHAAGLCGLAEVQKKAVQVPTTLGDLSVGQEVEVCLRKTMGYKAVWIAYVIPLVVLIAGIVALTALGLGELAAGLVSIGLVALYYLAVYLLRSRLQNDYSFFIKQI